MFWSGNEVVLVSGFSGNKGKDNYRLGIANKGNGSSHDGPNLICLSGFTHTDDSLHSHAFRKADPL